MARFKNKTEIVEMKKKKKSRYKNAQRFRWYTCRNMTYEIKQARNLFDPLTKNENSVLYEESDLINNLIEKIR